MSIEITLADSGRYMILRVNEPISSEVAREMGRRAQKLADQTGIESRLVDVRESRNVATVAANYDLAYKELEDLKIPRGAKAAVLVGPDDESHDFVLIAIRNAGFNARKFIDEAMAIAWLEES